MRQLADETNRSCGMQSPVSAELKRRRHTCPYDKYFFSHPSTSPYQCLEFCGLRIQWFSSG